MGLVRNLEVNTTVVGNVGAGLDTLHSFPLPANSLRNDDDYLSVWYGGDFAANDTDKLISASFGGTSYIPNGAVDLDRSIGWAIQVRIVRLSSTSVRVSYVLAFNEISADSANVVNTFGSGGYFQAFSVDITGLPNLNTNATTMLVSGQGAADDDVIQNLSIIELVQN